MLIKLLTPAILITLLSGCQSTNTYPPIEKKIIAPPNLSQELEGTEHKVWKEASYKKIRSELQDGEIIIFKNVEAKLYGSTYIYLGDIYSLDGQMLFDKKYSLQDVGVIGMKKHINKNINNDVVKVTRGVRYHGDIIASNGFSETYWKTTGGKSPTAIPVRDYTSSLTNKHDAAKTHNYGLRMNCFKGDVYVSFLNRETYAATGEDITVTVYAPYLKGKTYQSESVGHTGVSLKVDKYIDRILLEDDAIKLQAYSHANRKFVEVTAYNNGLTEAYTRVKNNCAL